MAIVSKEKIFENRLAIKRIGDTPSNETIAPIIEYAKELFVNELLETPVDLIIQLDGNWVELQFIVRETEKSYVLSGRLGHRHASPPQTVCFRADAVAAVETFKQVKLDETIAHAIVKANSRRELSERNKRYLNRYRREHKAEISENKEVAAILKNERRLEIICTAADYAIA